MRLLLNIRGRGGGGGRHGNFSHLLWFLIMSQLFASGMALFFPMFTNFFGKFGHNNNNNNNNRKGGLGGGATPTGNGGVSIFNTAASTSNAVNNQSTSIRVPMFSHLGAQAQRRVDVVTTVISPVSQSSSPVSNEGNVTSNATVTTVEVHQNVSTTFPDQTVQQTSQKFVIPTSTSVTSSISAIHQGVPVQPRVLGLSVVNPTAFTLPFTPNLFGLMSYIQAMKDIKRNYKDQEKERKVDFHNKDSGDLMTRILRSLIYKVVNKHQKHTEMLRLQILKRQAKLQKFLQMPMISQVVALDQARAAAQAGDGVVQPGAGVVV